MSSHGIRNTINIDDGRVLATSKEEVKIVGTFTYNTITKAGWSIEVSKSDKVTEVVTEESYLGFHLDTTKMLVSSPEMKLQKTETIVREILQRTHSPPKYLTKVLGTIISLEPSHGMLARISTRSGYCAEHTESEGWSGLLPLSAGIQRELLFFLNNFRKMNGNPMRSKLREIHLETILENPIVKTMSLPFHEKPDLTFVSDASDSKVYVYILYYMSI